MKNALILKNSGKFAMCTTFAGEIEELPIIDKLFYSVKDDRTSLLSTKETVSFKNLNEVSYCII